MKKKKYEKPSLKVVEIELSKCIAASTTSVKQGESEHWIIESDGTATWDDAPIELEGGKPKPRW